MVWNRGVFDALDSRLESNTLQGFADITDDARANNYKG
jgi:hypothetical protein